MLGSFFKKKMIMTYRKEQVIAGVMIILNMKVMGINLSLEDYLDKIKP